MLEWNETGRVNPKEPIQGKEYLVRLEEEFSFGSSSYTLAPVYFVAEWYNGWWYATTEHLDVDAGWDGGNIVQDFNQAHITGWAEINDHKKEQS